MREAAERSGYITFRPRARLLRLIGAELISDEIVAITELVKNAHDADASGVTLEFRGVTSPEGTVTVLDDGCGMDLDTLLRHWMEPAGTSKIGQHGQRTRRGRRVLGEKGIGRFAADKLGRRLELVSRAEDSDTEIRAMFDWDRFDSETDMLSDVRNRWETRPPREIKEQGTILRMTSLRTPWTERMFRRLSTRLSRLQSPFRGVDGFTIRIDSDEFPQYSGELRAEFLERAPYRIEASFDGEQTVVVSINGGPGVRNHWNGAGPLSCGPSRVRLFAFDLESDAVARIGPKMEARAWLREWSGVSIYRDGFRVWPYGEPHDDWLRLDQRRVNNPVVRLSNNQVVGFVEISRDGNPELRDQTNREGLIRNPAFEDLRRLMYFVLQLLEAERQSLRHPRVRGASSVATSNGETSTLPEIAEDLARKATGEVATELRRLSAKLREAAERDARLQRRFIEGHAELAALGQAAHGFCLALGPLLEEIRTQCRELRTSLARRRVQGKGLSTRTIEMLVDAVRERVGIITVGADARTRRRRAIDVLGELRRVRDLLHPLLDAARVRMMLGGSGLVRAEMRPETFHRLVCVLALNSLEWLRGVKAAEIRVGVRTRGNRCEIVFSDNGRGIPRDNVEKVFEPLFSGKEGGRGMGLTIAKGLISLHGGTIETLIDARRRGAHFRILLPRKRARATLGKA
jgi:signal transduction histidine kinase